VLVYGLKSCHEHIFIPDLQIKTQNNKSCITVLLDMGLLWAVHNITATLQLHGFPVNFFKVLPVSCHYFKFKSLLESLNKFCNLYNADFQGECPQSKQNQLVKTALPSSRTLDSLSELQATKMGTPSTTSRYWFSFFIFCTVILFIFYMFYSHHSHLDTLTLVNEFNCFCDCHTLE